MQTCRQFLAKCGSWFSRSLASGNSIHGRNTLLVRVYYAVVVLCYLQDLIPFAARLVNLQGNDVSCRISTKMQRRIVVVHLALMYTHISQFVGNELVAEVRLNCVQIRTSVSKITATLRCNTVVFTLNALICQFVMTCTSSQQHATATTDTQKKRATAHHLAACRVPHCCYARRRMPLSHCSL